MKDIRFIGEQCKHKGWAERYKYTYDQQAKTATCSHCGNTVNYEEIDV